MRKPIFFYSVGFSLVFMACGKPPDPSKPVGPGASSSTVPAEPQAQLRESLTQAIEAAETILKISPKDPEALLAAALAAEHLGLTAKAIHYYARLQESTQETEYLRNLAELQTESSPDVAAIHASRFFEQGGVEDRLRLWLVRHHVQKKEFEKAFRLTEQLPPPSDRSSREFLRDLCLRRARALPMSSLAALAALRRAASFAPLPVDLAETVAQTFLAAGDAESAREVLKSHPGSVHVLRSKIADKLGDSQDALSQRLKYFHSGGSDPKELFVLLVSLGRAPPARQVGEQLWRSKDLDARMRLEIARRLAPYYRETPDTPLELRFLEEAKVLGDPEILDRLADLQRALGNAREALSALRSRYPRAIPDNKIELYVVQALAAGEALEAVRAAEEAPPTALSPATRRRLAEILNVAAEGDLAAGQASAAKSTALRADRFRPDLRNQKLLAKVSLLESDTPAALSRLTGALKLLPADPEASYLAGKIFFQQSRWADAKPQLQAAYTGHFPAGDLPLMLGRIHFSQQSMPMAYPLLKEYAEGQSGRVPPDVQEQLARAAMNSGHAADAALWFERRLEASSDEKISAEFLEALLSAGQRAKALGQARSLVVKYRTSRPILEAASNVFDFSTDSVALLKTLESLWSLESNPEKKSTIQRRLLDIKIRMGRPAEADALLSSLLERTPNDAQLLTTAWNLRKGTPAAQPILDRLAVLRSSADPIQMVRARQLMDDKQYADALAVVRNYLATRKEDPSGLGVQAEIHARMGNAEGAAASYRALFQISRDDAARQWLIQYAYDQALAAVASGKMPANAEALYAEAVQLLGSEETYRDLYEIFGKLLGREVRTRSPAIDALQRELRLTKDAKKRMKLTETLGQWYFDDGQLSLAKEMFSHSAATGNTSPVFLRSYARLLSRIGETEEAASRYETLLKQSPYDQEANLFLARRAAEQGRRDESIRSLEALRTASPADTNVLDALGNAYVATGRHADAVQVWRALADRTASPKYISRHADALYESGRYKSALQDYRSLNLSGDASAPQLRRLAELEQSDGNWTTAEDIILRLLRMGGTDKDRKALAELLRRMGTRSVRQGNVAEASRTAERLLALNEHDPAAFLLMGRAKLLEGNTTAAAESFSRAASLSPGDARAILGLAEVEFRQKRAVAAIDYARKALAIDTANPEAHTLMGLAYQQQGDARNAYESFKQALLYSKNRAAAHVRMGDLFLHHAKYNVALEQYRQALAIDPRNAFARLRNAAALNKLGFTETAMKELLMAMELDPAGAGAEARVQLSEIFASHGDVNQAQKILESAASTALPASPRVLFKLGEIARQNGEFERSVKLFRDALAKSGEAVFRYDVLNALGLALSSLDEEGAAEKVFREAHLLQPRRPDAFLNLSLLYRGQKKFLEAVDHARKAIGAKPDSPEGYKLLGLIYYEAGWGKESLSAFRESLRLRPDQPDIVNLVRRIEAPEEEPEE